MMARVPVQSTTMSPGSSFSRASSAPMVPETRSTVPVSRASISSLSRFSTTLSGTKPRAHSSRRARRSGATARR